MILIWLIFLWVYVILWYMSISFCLPVYLLKTEYGSRRTTEKNQIWPKNLSCIEVVIEHVQNWFKNERRVPVLEYYRVCIRKNVSEGNNSVHFQLHSLSYSQLNLLSSLLKLYGIIYGTYVVDFSLGIRNLTIRREI